MHVLEDAVVDRLHRPQRLIARERVMVLKEKIKFLISRTICFLKPLAATPEIHFPHFPFFVAARAPATHLPFANLA
jgi:hypothetical protein